jgi:hypothetical protein
MSAPPAKLGTPVHAGPRTWVQTERAAHEQWSALTMRSPRAAALMHRFVALMGHQNAVVVSQKTLAKMMGCTDRTIRNALADLVRERWVQVVQLGSSATVNAYVVNSNVAWGEKRDLRGRLTVFNAVVVGDLEDQPADTLDAGALRRVPVIFPPEKSLAVGEGEPGAQIAFPGMEAVVEGPSEESRAGMLSEKIRAPNVGR